MRALALTDHWPVGTVAAGVRTAEGSTWTTGDVEHPFALASVTKLLSAYAVLVASEEGTVELDQAAGPPGATVRHLLAHASGLGPDQPPTPLAPPGSRRIYSNAGFELLGDLVASASGLPFTTYLHEAVLQPLGMGSTHLDGSPAHAAVGTVADLLAFVGELFGPRLLAPGTVAAATTVAFPGLAGVLPGFGRQLRNDWGLGFELRAYKAPHWTGTRCSPRTFGHFGRSGTFLWVDPVAAVALVVLTDRPFDAWAADAWPELADAVLAELGRR